MVLAGICYREGRFLSRGYTKRAACKPLRFGLGAGIDQAYAKKEHANPDQQSLPYSRYPSWPGVKDMLWHGSEGCHAANCLQIKSSGKCGRPGPEIMVLTDKIGIGRPIRTRTLHVQPLLVPAKRW